MEEGQKLWKDISKIVGGKVKAKETVSSITEHFPNGILKVRNGTLYIEAEQTYYLDEDLETLYPLVRRVK
jgi:hypothetical protein